MKARDPGRVRLAGHDVDRLGRDVTWTVADGERGRRWRELTIDPASGVQRSLSLETGRGGQWLRLELAAPAGLLSLHPAADGTIHGNVVTAEGVRHLALGALDPALLDIPGSIVGETALCRSLERFVPAGQGSPFSVARVSEALEVVVAEIRAERHGPRAWEVLDDRETRAIRIGDLGVPAEGPSSARWPLETGS